MCFNEVCSTPGTCLACCSAQLPCRADGKRCPGMTETPLLLKAREKKAKGSPAKVRPAGDFLFRFTGSRDVESQARMKMALAESQEPDPSQCMRRNAVCQRRLEREEALRRYLLRPSRMVHKPGARAAGPSDLGLRQLGFLHLKSCSCCMHAEVHVAAFAACDRLQSQQRQAEDGRDKGWISVGHPQSVFEGRPSAPCCSRLALDVSDLEFPGLQQRCRGSGCSPPHCSACLWSSKNGQCCRLQNLSEIKSCMSHQASGA